MLSQSLVSGLNFHFEVMEWIERGDMIIICLVRPKYKDRLEKKIQKVLKFHGNQGICLLFGDEFESICCQQILWNIEKLYRNQDKISLGVEAVTDGIMWEIKTQTWKCA